VHLPTFRTRSARENLGGVAGSQDAEPDLTEVQIRLCVTHASIERQQLLSLSPAGSLFVTGPECASVQQASRLDVVNRVIPRGSEFNCRGGGGGGGAEEDIYVRTHAPASTV
jgi:hypothetical protein